MLSAMNLAGFGAVAWDDDSRSPDLPWTYRTAGLPFFDRNLRALSRKARATALLGHVRGVLLSEREVVNEQNVHPFRYEGTPIALAMNGDLDRFPEMRVDVANLVDPEIAKRVEGTTDSEWLYALILSRLEDPFAPAADPEELAAATEEALRMVRDVRVRRGFERQSAVNLVISDGHCLIATRFAFDYGWYHEGWTFAGGERRYDYTTLWYAAGTGYGCHEGEWGVGGGKPADVADRGVGADHPRPLRLAGGARVLPARRRPGRAGPRRGDPGARCLRTGHARRWPAWSCSTASRTRCSTAWRRPRIPFTLAAGEYLFREGDPGEFISLLESGRVDAILRLPGGRELEVQPVGPGELIGEMGVLSQRPRRISVRAAEDTAGWNFSLTDIGRLGAAEQPEVARRLGRLALGRLRDQYARLDALCGDDPRAAEPARSASFYDATPVLPVEREDGETAYLETVLFFSRFSPEEIEELFGDLRRLEAPRGADVGAEGSLLVVLKGAIETSIRRGGLAARARLAGPGRFVGHLNLLGEEAVASSSRAREHAILLELPLERVAEIIERGDDTGRRFGLAVYADVVDALFEAQRPIARMAAAGGL